MVDEYTENDRLKGLLRLIDRSPDQGDGWRNVSETCWPLVKDMPPELAEVESAEVGGRIRMTSEGRAVLQFA